MSTKMSAQNNADGSPGDIDHQNLLPKRLGKQTNGVDFTNPRYVY